MEGGNGEITGIDGAVGVDTGGHGLTGIRVLLEEVPLPLGFEGSKFGNGRKEQVPWVIQIVYGLTL